MHTTKSIQLLQEGVPAAFELHRHNHNHTGLEQVLDKQIERKIKQKKVYIFDYSLEYNV